MIDFLNFSFVHEAPPASGLIKQTCSDFIVHEKLGFSLSGSGEHQFLYIEKEDINTEEVAIELASSLKKSAKEVSYAGLKDKKAVTRQWFSVHCPGQILSNLEQLTGEKWRIIEAKRHDKKLRLGALAANQFYITIRELSNRSDIELRLARLKEQGVPNYFGPQRFGRDGNNLIKAQQILLQGKKVKNRFLKGIYYSAARALLFNQILSARVHQQNWHKPLAGDVFQLAGSHSIFTVEMPDEVIEQRVAEFDISPTAPLWGKGEVRQFAVARDLQNKVLDNFKEWTAALEEHELTLAYRPLVLPIKDLQWDWHENHLCLQFILPPGCYATSVLRELVQFAGIIDPIYTT